MSPILVICDDFDDIGGIIAKLPSQRVLPLDYYFEIAADADKPNSIKRLLSALKPDVIIFTATTNLAKNARDLFNVIPPDSPVCIMTKSNSGESFLSVNLTRVTYIVNEYADRIYLLHHTDEVPDAAFIDAKIDYRSVDFIWMDGRLIPIHLAIGPRPSITEEEVFYD